MRLVLDNDFWHFSCKVYADIDVRQQRLELQALFGVDFNLLLFTGWLGHCGIQVTDQDIDDVSGLVKRWHCDVIRPLRAARQAAKASATDPAIGGLRDCMMQLGLAAEQVEQAMLFQWAGSRLGATHATAGATNNIMKLLRVGDVPADTAQRASATLDTAIRQL